MLDQNLCAESDQNDTARNFGFGLPPFPDLGADSGTDKAEEEGDSTDEGKRERNARLLVDGKRDACSHSINAGRDGKAEHNTEGKRGILRITAGAGVTFLDCFHDHLDTQEDKESKCNIGGDAFYVICHKGGEEPTEEGHECLENSKPRATNEPCFNIIFFGAKPLTYADGKGVHRKSDSKQ